MIVNIEETGAVRLPDDPDVQSVADSVLAEVLRMTGAPADMCVDLWLCEAEEIRTLNRQYRSIDAVTDVLSFPNFDMNAPAVWPDPLPEDAYDPDTARYCLGSVAVCKERVLKQAEEYGHSVKRETAFLIAHSALHLCGYDHETDREASVMEEMQEQVLQKLGIRRS